MTANDPDAGATQTYSIIGGADAALFTIDATTGALSFLAAPNFESPADAGANNIYDVTVQVSDGTLTDSQAIAVTVTNVNEAPVITSNGAGATAAISVTENSTTVTTVAAIDPDAGATLTLASPVRMRANSRSIQRRAPCPSSRPPISKRRRMQGRTTSTT